MGVDRQARQPETDTPDHVGRLAAHPRQADQVLHGCGHHAGESLVDGPAEPDEALRLGTEETGRVDESLQLGRVGLAQIGRRRVTGEDRRRDHVDPFIGGLGREHRGHQQLKWIVEVKCTQFLGRPGVLEGQAASRLSGPSFWSSRSGHAGQRKRPGSTW